MTEGKYRLDLDRIQFSSIQFNLYLPYIQNSAMEGWNNEIKEKVNGEET